jgi:ParB family chromosome partitioning protein
MMETNSKKQRLGRGLDSLLAADFDKKILLDTGEPVKKIPLSDIEPNVDQPRKNFDERALNELAASIKQYGVIQPMVVTPKGKKYEIIAGERRWRASKLAGLDTVPAIIRTAKESEKLELALIENVQRVDLSPLEQAVSIEGLHQQFSLSYSEIAKRLGKAETTVSNIVRLLQLPDDAAVALQEGRITEGHARAILALKNDLQLQHRLLELIEGQGWSVRQAEQFVTAQKQGVKPEALNTRIKPENADTKKLSKKLGYPVTLRRTAAGGRLEVHFKDEEDLTALYKKLGA